MTGEGDTKVLRLEDLKVNMKDLAIAKETMGINVLKQLKKAVPNFFRQDYIIMKMVNKPLEEQTTPLVKYQEPRVMASKNPFYPVDSVLNLEDKLTEVMKEGNCVTVSPREIREPGIATSQEMLETEPFDKFVIAQVEMGAGTGFGEPRIMYSNNATLRKRGDISYGTLQARDFIDGVCRNNIHFAFVPVKDIDRSQYVFLKPLKSFEHS